MASRAPCARWMRDRSMAISVSNSTVPASLAARSCAAKPAIDTTLWAWHHGVWSAPTPLLHLLRESWGGLELQRARVLSELRWPKDERGRTVPCLTTSCPMCPCDSAS